MNMTVVSQFFSSHQVVERIGWILLHSLWQFTALAMFACIIVHLMRQASSTARYGLLLACLAMFVATPILTGILLPHGNPTTDGDLTFPVEPLTGAGDEISISDPAALGTSKQFSAVVLPETPKAAGKQIQRSLWQRTKKVLQPWLNWIVAGWVIGVMLFSARPVLGWWFLNRLRNSGITPTTTEIQALLARTAQLLGIRRSVCVAQSALARVPVVVGYLKPVILLPVSLVSSLPVAQLESILAHELAHIKRHDFPINLIQSLIETLFFYHPAAWWLSRCVRIEREHCCDDLVIEHLGNRVEYGRALVSIEEHRGRLAFLALGASDGSLLARVRRITCVIPEHQSGSIPERWVMSIFGILMVSATAIVPMTLATADDEKVISSAVPPAAPDTLPTPAGGIEEARVDVAPAGETDLNPESLIAAHADWTANTQFSSHYSYYVKHIEPDVDPFETAWVADATPTATGVFNKDKMAARYSRIYTNDPKVISRDEKLPNGQLVRTVTRTSWDSTYDERMALMYWPGWKDETGERYFDNATFMGRDFALQHRDGKFDAESEMSPLNPFPGEFRRLPGEPRDSSEWRIVRTSASSVVIGRSTANEQLAIEYEIEFWTVPARPVPLRILITFKAEGRGSQSEARMSEWLQCGQYMVPKKVVSALTIQTRRANETEVKTGIRVQVWNSADLSDKVPTEEDRSITVPATTSIVGLFDAPPEGKERILSVSGIDPGRLMPEGTVIYAK
jgi:beta-lactamase regulating signal transducer with metallopeptidase domain